MNIPGNGVLGLYMKYILYCFSIMIIIGSINNWGLWLGGCSVEVNKSLSPRIINRTKAKPIHIVIESRAIFIIFRRNL